MHPLRFGLKLSQAATIDVLRDVWRIADDGGFDHCWNMDHLASLGDGGDRRDIFEAWTLLAGMAVATSRVRIGCSVTGNTYRHPGLLAKAAVTVDHLSGGRLEFGIGAGWAENEHTMLGLEFGTVGDRADRLAEAVPILRSLWTQAHTTAHGTHYDLTDAVAEPKPVQRPHPPIWIGGTGRRRTLRLAAEHAAVWNAPGGEPELVAELSAVLDEHCAAIGRDPTEIRRSVQIRVPDDLATLPEQVAAHTAVGVTEIILIVAGDEPARTGDAVAELLPDLRRTGGG